MPSRLEAAVELRPGEKRTRQTQDLVCLAQLAHFSLQRFDAFFFSSGRPWTLAGIALLLAYPAPQRLWCAADLGRNRRDGCPLRFVLAGSLADHAHSALDDFGGILGLLLHSSIFSNNGASTKSGAVQQARQAMQEAEIDYRNAEQKLRALGSSAHSKGGLNSYELRAPFNGVVVEKAVSLGQSVKEDSSLFTIADLSTVWADVAVPAGDLGNVRVGEQVTVRASALETKAVGKIAYVGSLLGAETRTATARVVLPNPALSWRPGLFVNVDVQLQSNQREAPVTVAAAALQTVEEKPTVFVRMPGGFRAEHVTLGRRDAAMVEVTKGLAPGTEYAAGNSFVIKAELGKSSDEDSH